MPGDVVGASVHVLGRFSLENNAEPLSASLHTATIVKQAKSLFETGQSSPKIAASHSQKLLCDRDTSQLV